MQTKPNGQNRDIYILDAANRVAAVNEYGIEVEGLTGKVAGGGMFDWPDERKPSSVVVLVAPSMLRRFKALDVTEEGTFLVRTDGIRCHVICDPLLADALCGTDTVMVTEASGQSDGENITYEVIVNSGNTPSMRM